MIFYIILCFAQKTPCFSVYFYYLFTRNFKRCRNCFYQKSGTESQNFKKSNPHSHKKTAQRKKVQNCARQNRNKNKKTKLTVVISKKKKKRNCRKNYPKQNILCGNCFHSAAEHLSHGTEHIKNQRAHHSAHKRGAKRCKLCIHRLSPAYLKSLDKMLP